MKLRFIVRRSGASTELGDNFDLPDDGIVERLKVFRRNPILQVIFSSCLLDLIAIPETSWR
jgi:hypothetical protein